MDVLDMNYEVDHETRVFRARADEFGLLVEGKTRDELRHAVRDTVREHFSGGDLPRQIRLVDQRDGRTVESIVLGMM